MDWCEKLSTFSDRETEDSERKGRSCGIQKRKSARKEAARKCQRHSRRKIGTPSKRLWAHICSSPATIDPLGQPKEYVDNGGIKPWAVNVRTSKTEIALNTISNDLRSLVHFRHGGWTVLRDQDKVTCSCFEAGGSNQSSPNQQQALDHVSRLAIAWGPPAV
ncbi:conserved hypothetical protein [Coccidioides posadasii str. Silveira]|uniref:Uncharacterized protein n=1 Tax=Coccidioides posadasii (strain RMSCC 757 / Silveira) TaxID=443226 RepID=E9D034_COCPS|nr:conserved hypothetical protein [Coccidioides posadasii str. Silveira]